MKRLNGPVFGSFAFVALLLVSLLATARTDSYYVCEVSGSTKTCSRWFCLIDVNSVKASPLEEFVQRTHPQLLRHRWIWMCETDKNVFGMRLSTGHGSKPTYGLVSIVGGGAFARLPERDKWRVYCALASCSTRLPDDRKREMYDGLSGAILEEDLAKVDANLIALLDKYCRNAAPKR